MTAAEERFRVSLHEAAHAVAAIEFGAMSSSAGTRAGAISDPADLPSNGTTR
jgi:hypothetical protein